MRNVMEPLRDVTERYERIMERYGALRSVTEPLRNIVERYGTLRSVTLRNVTERHGTVTKNIDFAHFKF